MFSSLSLPSFPLSPLFLRRITAAVSDKEGLAVLNAYGTWGESSSLNEANEDEPWEYDWYD